MEIRFLKEDEFFDLRELLNGVFSRHRGRESRFDKVFPRLFATPNEYVTSSHLGAFDGDRLIGTAALYKLDYVVGTEHIKLIGNGNVAVHEDYRGQGVMSKLLDAVNDECDKIGDVGYLHGNRERYARWDYIGNGTQYELTFEPTDDNYEFVTMTDAHVDFCRELSHKKVDYILRKREDFEPSLRSGGREAVSVMKNGNLVGFMSLNRDNAFVEESAFDGEIEKQVFGALAKLLDKPAKVRFSGYDIKTVKRLDPLGKAKVSEPALFRIINPDRLKAAAISAGCDENTLYAPYLT